MTLSEFKAWLDGFSEAMGEAPTPEQWAKIKRKLDDVQLFPAQIIPPVYRTQNDDHLRTIVTCKSGGVDAISTQRLEN